MSYPAPCQITLLCATWLILNTRLCLQGERVEWGRVTHTLVPSTEMCAGTAALEENCVRLHLLLGRVSPLWDKGLDELEAFRFMHLYHCWTILVACQQWKS